MIRTKFYTPPQKFQERTVRLVCRLPPQNLSICRCSNARCGAETAKNKTLDLRCVKTPLQWKKFNKMYKHVTGKVKKQVKAVNQEIKSNHFDWKI